MFHDLTKEQKRALRAAAALAHERDRTMKREDRDVHYLEARNADLPLVVGGAVFEGIISLDDVGEVARELVRDIVERLNAVQEDLNARPEPEEENDPFDPAAVVSLEKVVAEAESLYHDDVLLVNRSTGDVTVLKDWMLAEAEEGDDAEEGLHDTDWETEAIEKAREIVADANWVELLVKDDIDEMRLMRRFADNARPSVSRDLLAALSGAGAYRRFRDVVRDRGVQDEWDAYRREGIALAVRSALEEKEVPYRK